MTDQILPAIPANVEKLIEDVRNQYIEDFFRGENSFVAYSVIKKSRDNTAEIKTFSDEGAEVWNARKVTQDHSPPESDHRIAQLRLLLVSDRSAVSQFVASQLAANEIDDVWLSALIYAAEDIQFTSNLQDQVCHRLLHFARNLQQSRKPEGAQVMKSALRRAISLLKEDEFGELLPFLDRRGTYVDARLTVVKAITSAFSLRPPNVDLSNLANRVAEIARMLLHPDVFEGDHIGAIALDAVHATAVLGGEQLLDLISQVSDLRKPWLVRTLSQRLSATKTSWELKGYAERVVSIRNALSRLAK